jgi:hypothetical protein
LSDLILFAIFSASVAVSISNEWEAPRYSWSQGYSIRRSANDIGGFIDAKAHANDDNATEHF